MADRTQGKNENNTKNKKNDAKSGQPETRKKANRYGRVIRKYREKADISQRQASRELGYSQSMLSNIENGVNLPQLENVVPICDYLQIPLDEFFGRKNSGGSLSSIEEELIRLYREAAPEVREAIMTLLRSSQPRQKVVQYPTEGTPEGLKFTEASQPLKRGRGRPRKERDPAEEQKPKRGRGRPRKNPLPEEAE